MVGKKKKSCKSEIQLNLIFVLWWPVLSALYVSGHRRRSLVCMHYVHTYFRDFFAKSDFLYGPRPRVFSSL
ncbi:hypothetical protein BZA77DRAFT_307662 [Pyronema omphalodes]|nr:hypothetical protein BZA77DRAFT_307662 [Pyronema omphalodes]